MAATECDEHGEIESRDNSQMFTETHIKDLEKTIEDSSDQSVIADYMFAKNIEFKEKIRKLEYELYLWTRCANDCKEKLKRVNYTKNKKPFPNVFFESSLIRVMQTLAEENILMSEICDVETSSERRSMHNEKSISTLQEQLEVKFRENQRLRQVIESIRNSQGSNVNLEKIISKLEGKYYHIEVENKNLKLNLLTKDKLMIHLNSRLRELVEKVVDLFEKHDDKFITQLDSLADMNVKADVATNTTESLSSINDNLRDLEENTGCKSETFPELAKAAKELKLAKERILELETRASRKNDNNTLEKFIKEKERKIIQLENHFELLKSRSNDQRKKLADSECDLMSWQNGLHSITEDMSKLNEERNYMEKNYKKLEEDHEKLLRFSRQANEMRSAIRDGSRSRTQSLANQVTNQHSPISDFQSLDFVRHRQHSPIPEPHETANWGESSMRSIPVKDSPTKLDANPPSISSNAVVASHNLMGSPATSWYSQDGSFGFGRMSNVSYCPPAEKEDSECVTCEKCGKEFKIELYLEHQKFCQ